jgi:ABC-type arginine transport system permease subunit
MSLWFGTVVIIYLVLAIIQAFKLRAARRKLQQKKGE